MDIILAENVSTLIRKWMDMEKRGIQFPVDFDAAWKIAGYSRKDSAKRYLPKSSQGKFFHVSAEKSGGQGRPKEVISLSCDGLKHLCLMADTPQGESVRQYFIEVEKQLQSAVAQPSNTVALPQNYIEALKALVAAEER